jgi:hypothetical protein
MLDLRQALSAAARKAGLEVPEPAVYTPEARAALIAMRDEDSVVETLGDDTLLSDLLAGSSAPPGQPATPLSWKIGIGVAAVGAVLLGFFLAGGGSTGEAETSPRATEPVGGEPTAVSAEVAATAASEEAGPAPEAEAVEEPSSEAGGIEEVSEAEEPPDVVHRLAVKRGTTQRPVMARPPEMETPATEGSEGSAGEIPETTPETPNPGMRRIGPRVVREF